MTLLGDYDAWRLAHVPTTFQLYEGLKLYDQSPKSDLWFANALALELKKLYKDDPKAAFPDPIVKLNWNYGDDPDKGVIFHCSNLPKDIFETGANTPTFPIAGEIVSLKKPGANSAANYECTDVSIDASASDHAKIKISVERFYDITY